MDFPYWEWCGLFILGVTLIPYDRVRTVSILNIIFFACTGGLLSITSPAVNSEVQFSHSSWFDALTTMLLIGALYFTLFQLMIRHKFLRRPVLVGLLLIAALGAVLATQTESLAKIPVLYRLSAALFIAMIRVFWSACYQLSEIDMLRSRPFWEHAGTLAFPWQFGWASPNIVRGYSDLRNEAPQSAIELRESQISGAKLMVCALLMHFAAEQLSEFVFSRTTSGGEIVISPMSQWLGVEFSTTNYLSQGMPRYAAWIFVFATSVHFLLALAATTNAAVSIARMCGFMVFRNVYRPFQANSFNNFLGRMYYYYIAILLRFMFYPLWRALRPVRQKRLRIFLTHFFTIMGGGFLTSALRYAPIAMPYGFTPLIDLLWIRWPYFVALATISGLTALLPEWKSLGHARGVWYFIVYTLCFSLQIHYYGTSVGETWSAFLYLFHL